MNQQPRGSVMPETAPDPRRWWALALLCGALETTDQEGDMVCGN
jgi:hypothetical protein